MAALELMDPQMDCCEIPADSAAVPPPAAAAAAVGKSSKGPDLDIRVPTVPPRIPPTCLDPQGVNSYPSLPWNTLTMTQARIIGAESMSRLESMLGGSSVSESTFTSLYAHDGVLRDMAKQLGWQPQHDKPNGLNGVTTAKGDIGIDKLGYLGTPQQHAVFACTVALVKVSEVVRMVVQHADIYEEEDFSVGAHGFEFSPWIEESEVIGLLESTLKILQANTDNGDAATQRSTDEDVDMLILIIGSQLDLFRACTSLTIDPDDNYRPFVQLAFDSFVNRPLLGNAPVRAVNFLPPSDAIMPLKVVFEGLAWAVCDLILYGSTFGRIKRMLCRVSISSVNILARSFILLNLYFDDLLVGQYSLSSFIAQHMNQTGGVPRNLLEGAYGRTILSRLAKPLYDTLKVLVLNRNRQRAYIDVVMVKEWSMLQKESAAVDFYYNQELGTNTKPIPYVTNYALSTSLGLLEHFMRLGVELHLFHGHHDLAIAYWYWDFLLSTCLNTATVMRKTKAEERLEVAKKEEALEAAAAAEKKSSKKKGPKQGKKGVSKIPVSSAATATATTAEDAEDNLEYMLLGVRRNICRGLVRFIAALSQAGLVTPPQYEFTSHEQRFRKRFELFTRINQPPALTYADFLKGSDCSGVSPSDLLASVSECFKASKTMLDKILVQIENAIDIKFLPVTKQEATNLVKIYLNIPASRIRPRVRSWDYLRFVSCFQKQAAKRAARKIT
eukprot:scaffold7608_cov67-Attheya_sp.AAC.4